MGSYSTIDSQLQKLRETTCPPLCSLLSLLGPRDHHEAELTAKAFDGSPSLAPSVRPKTQAVPRSDATAPDSALSHGDWFNLGIHIGKLNLESRSGHSPRRSRSNFCEPTLHSINLYDRRRTSEPEAVLPRMGYGPASERPESDANSQTLLAREAQRGTKPVVESPVISV